jgi:mannosyl-oligosaccharide glucosidase
MEGFGSLEVVGAEAAEESGFDRNVIINGQTTDLGEFSLTITDPLEGNEHPTHNHPSYHSKPLENTFVHSVQVPDEALWQSKRKSRISPYDDKPQSC